MHRPSQSTQPPASDQDQSTDEPSSTRQRNFTARLSVPQLPGAMERVSRQRQEELEYLNHPGRTQTSGPGPYLGAEPGARLRHRDSPRPWPGQSQADRDAPQHPPHYQYAPHGPSAYHPSQSSGSPQASPVGSTTQYSAPSQTSAPNTSPRPVFPYGGPTGVRSPQACDACRKRKVRCSLVQQEEVTALSSQSTTDKLCVRCSRLGIPCVWKDERKGKTKTSQGPQGPDGTPEQYMSVNTSASYSQVRAPSNSPAASSSGSSSTPTRSTGTQGWSSPPNMSVSHLNPSFPNAPSSSRGDYASYNTQPSTQNYPPQNLHFFHSNPNFPRSSTPNPTSISALHPATFSRDRADSMSVVDEETLPFRSPAVSSGNYPPVVYSYSAYGGQETDQMAYGASPLQQPQSTPRIQDLQPHLHLHQQQHQQPQQYSQQQPYHQHPQYTQHQQFPSYPEQS